MDALLLVLVGVAVLAVVIGVTRHALGARLHADGKEASKARQLAYDITVGAAGLLIVLVSVVTGRSLLTVEEPPGGELYKTGVGVAPDDRAKPDPRHGGFLVGMATQFTSCDEPVASRLAWSAAPSTTSAAEPNCGDPPRSGWRCRATGSGGRLRSITAAGDTRTPEAAARTAGGPPRRITDRRAAGRASRRRDYEHRRHDRRLVVSSPVARRAVRGQLAPKARPGNLLPRAAAARWRVHRSRRSGRAEPHDSRSRRTRPGSPAARRSAREQQQHGVRLVRPLAPRAQRHLGRRRGSRRHRQV